MQTVPSYQAVARIATEIMQHRTSLNETERYMLGVKMLMHHDGPLSDAIRLHFGDAVLQQVKSSLFFPWVVPPGSQHLLGTELWTHADAFNTIGIGNLLALHEAAAANGFRTLTKGNLVYFVPQNLPRT